MEAELQKLEKRMQELKTNQALLQQKIADTKEEQEKVLAELKAMGVEQTDLDDLIAKMEKEVKEEMEACQKLLG